MAVPLRTCLICRQRAEKKSLYRLVRVGPELIYDKPQYRAPGRGYYICRKIECLGRFLGGKRRLGRLPIGSEALALESRVLLQGEYEKTIDARGVANLDSAGKKENQGL